MNVKIDFSDFLILLGVLFVVLRLCNVIDWSWIYVTLPFWLGWAILIGTMGTVAIMVILATIIKVCLKVIKNE